MKAAWRDAYCTQGFARVPQCASPGALEALERETARLFALVAQDDIRVQTRPSANGKPARDRIDPVADISPLFQEWAETGPLADLATSALGEPARVMKEKLTLRPPGADGYAPHQDITFWRQIPAPAQAMLTVGLAIDPCSTENGALEFWSGLRERDYVEGSIDGLFGSSVGTTPRHILAGHKPQLVPLAAGDAIVFSSLVPHHSGPNRAASTRRMFFVSYAAARYGDLRPTFYKGFQTAIQASAR